MDLDNDELNTIEHVLVALFAMLSAIGVAWVNNRRNGKRYDRRYEEKKDNGERED